MHSTGPIDTGQLEATGSCAKGAFPMRLSIYSAPLKLCKLPSMARKLTTISFLVFVTLLQRPYGHSGHADDLKNAIQIASIS